MSYAGVAIMCLFAALTLVAVAVAVLRGGGRRGRRPGGPDEGRGGGGSAVPRRPPPPDQPSGFNEPSWWPEFERERERWARERCGRRGPAEPLRG
jgi:hypothetical protein